MLITGTSACGKRKVQPYALVYVMTLETESKLKIFYECAANGKKRFFRIVNPYLDSTLKPWNELNDSAKVHDICTMNPVKFLLRKFFSSS